MTWPLSSIQCRRPACTSVKGLRSSTITVTRFGSSRTRSARCTSGSACTRSTTTRGSSVNRLVPGSMHAASTIRSRLTTWAPRTSTSRTGKIGEVQSHHPAAPRATGREAITRAIAMRRSTRPIAYMRRRARPRRSRWAPTNAERSPKSTTACPRVRGESNPLFTDHPDLLLQRDAELRVHALARHVHQREDLGGARPAAVHDEVRVLGGDLGPVVPLALEPHTLDQLRRLRAGRVLPHAADGGERERLRLLLRAQALLDLPLDLGDGLALQAQARADEHGARREVEGVERHAAGARLAFADGAVGVEEVDRA